jgi:hypothetical protein
MIAGFDSIARALFKSVICYAGVHLLDEDGHTALVLYCLPGEIL